MGFMLSTWFLSMWMSNTASTAVMMPVAMAVLGQLQDSSKKNKDHEEGVRTEQVTLNLIPEETKDTKIGKAAI